MSEHTPGPWSGTKLPSGDYQVGSWDAGEVVCEGATKADARLIAAAPDLLEALNLAVSLLEESRTAGSPQVVPASMRAAIAKAEGKG